MKVALNKTTTSLNVGGTETLTAIITPADATNKAVTWSNYNTSVATVDGNGTVTGGSASRLRPVFHWSAKRIRAHIAIRLVSFLLVSFLQHKLLRKTGSRLSAERIRDELYRIRETVILYTSNQNKYVIPSKPGKDTLKIYDTMHKHRRVASFGLNNLQ